MRLRGELAVRGTEALRAELAPRGVGVTCGHPGGVATRIALDSRIGRGVDEEQARAGQAAFGRLLRIPPERAAEVILVGVARRRARVLVGWSARAPDALARLSPRGSAAVFAGAEHVLARRGGRAAPR